MRTSTKLPGAVIDSKAPTAPQNPRTPEDPQRTRVSVVVNAQHSIKWQLSDVNSGNWNIDAGLDWESEPAIGQVRSAPRGKYRGRRTKYFVRIENCHTLYLQ
ncbi:hypothetical protein ACRALDRAFT_1064654 [Sodiomyces alcalophilus JCM 7366]|uniref:uncharacterized protein n=1 Tax=Sodiomyces alcalophilus JCM 7366 TaxID=591952 RepID=UPI0039B68059